MYTDGDDVRTKLGEGEILLVAVRAASLVGGGGNGVHEAQINGWLAIAAMLGLVVECWDIVPRWLVVDSIEHVDDQR